MRAACLCALAIASSGCRDRTQLMLGVVTDLKAPMVLDEVRMDVTRDGVTILQTSWNLPGIPNQPYILPGSYGLYSPDGSEPRVNISITGFKAGQPRVNRTAITSLVSGETLFLRMGLVLGCVDRTDCAPTQTCIESLCATPVVDSRTLPVFTEELVDHVVCSSGTSFIDTSTGDPMPPLGDMTCTGGDSCHEGTCYHPAPNDDLGPGRPDAMPVLTDMRRAPDIAVPDMTLPGDMALATPWLSQLSPTPNHLRAVWVAPGGAESFAVGDNGIILHLAGMGPTSSTAWALDTSPTSNNLRGLAGTSVDDLYAVGDSGTILYHSAGVWIDISQPTTASFYAVTADRSSMPGTRFWALGQDTPDGGTTLAATAFLGTGSYGDQFWTPTSIGAPGLLRAGSEYYGPAWAAGLNDTVLAGNGSTLAPVPLPFTGHDYVATWNDESTAWIFASDGTTLRGLSATDIQPGPTLFAVNGAFGLHRRAIWAVGTNGQVAFYDGQQWQPMPSGVYTNLNAVAGDAVTGFVAVGDNGVILANPIIPGILPGGIPDAGVWDQGVAVDLAGVPPSDLGFRNYCSINESFGGSDCTISEHCGTDTWQLYCPTDTAQPCTCSFNGSTFTSGLLLSRCIDAPTDTLMLRAFCNAP